jgi:hypothetical protein
MQETRVFMTSLLVDAIKIIHKNLEVNKAMRKSFVDELGPKDNLRLFADYKL